MRPIRYVQDRLNQDAHRREVLAVLLSDLVLYTLLTLAGLMTLEALMPGFVFGRVNMAFVVLWCAALMLAATALPPRAHAPLLGILAKKKTIRLAAGLWAILLLINASLNFGPILVPLIVCGGAVLAWHFLLYRREDA